MQKRCDFLTLTLLAPGIGPNYLCSIHTSILHYPIIQYTDYSQHQTESEGFRMNFLCCIGKRASVCCRYVRQERLTWPSVNGVHSISDMLGVFRVGIPTKFDFRIYTLHRLHSRGYSSAEVKLEHMLSTCVFTPDKVPVYAEYMRFTPDEVFD